MLFLSLRFNGGQFFCPRLLGFAQNPFDLLGQSFLRFNSNPCELGLESARLGFGCDSSLLGRLGTQTLGCRLGLGHFVSMERGRFGTRPLELRGVRALGLFPHPRQLDVLAVLSFHVGGGQLF